ncbi:hypothetical protein CCACVL1_15779 [Corchorus capsularis]|uniref:Uncharacterized protein n=1 Tax=Corchorus capsularis TaxID=210143 RepID=A0A1R3I161_COCAP|nr:hypothetical protein CCACVL1_15779 [Corchorus capsularis]
MEEEETEGRGWPSSSSSIKA